jgi:hypothetical protein
MEGETNEDFDCTKYSIYIYSYIYIFIYIYSYIYIYLRILVSDIAYIDHI